jgi:PIN domain nuclease of toxin-antitoxin system
MSFDEPSQPFVTEQLRYNQIGILDITIAHAARTIDLPYHHRDPFDRLIIVQALEEAIPLLSIDSVFDVYGIQRLW